jgi:cytochrome c553
VLAVLRKGRRAWLLAALLFSAPVAAALTERCAPCHGPDGNSTTPGIPSIAAQPKVFIENLLVLVREGLRGGEEMKQIMKGTSDRDIAALAAHYSKLPARSQPGAVDATLFQRGQELAAKNRCGVCHLPDFRGREQIPRLAGQREEFLFEIMRRFRDAPPPGSDTLMSAALYGVSDADIRALAHFLSRSR